MRLIVILSALFFASFPFLSADAVDKNPFDEIRAVKYGPKQVRDQIRAGHDQGVNGFMLWNAVSNFTIEAFK